ncbi:MAG: phosphatase PAP2 family protein [Bacteroidota bacterium]
MGRPLRSNTSIALFSIFQRLAGFLIVCGIGWLIWLGMLLCWGYEDSFLILNAIRHPLADLLMPHYTHFGDGLLICILVSLFFARKDLALILSLLVGMLLVGGVVYVGKHWIFEDWHRPVMVFLHRVEFFEIPLRRLFHFTFPSGHSAAVGGAVCFLAFHVGKRSWLGGLLALFSLSAAYSRLYIGVHFLGDVLVGHFLGVLCAVLSLGIAYPRFQRSLHTRPLSMLEVWKKRSWMFIWILLPISLSWIYVSEYL